MDLEDIRDSKDLSLVQHRSAPSWKKRFLISLRCGILFTASRINVRQHRTSASNGASQLPNRAKDDCVMRKEQPEGQRGSLKWIQRLVDSHPSILDDRL